MGQLKLHDTKILISENSLHDLLVYVNSYDVNNIFILVDENTYKYCYPILLTKIPFLKKSSVIKMKSGESYKSMDVATNVFSILLARGINRASLIINLGGGVICDIGGFIASVIKRGVNFINLPTTLMAQVDASVGGKVGVNFESSKNQIGLFSNPEVIFIYTPFVKSLPKEYFISACAEILKYGLIFDAEFWNEICKVNFKKELDLYSIICKCLSIKLELVRQDYYDYNERRKLNFGHSIGHAIESVFMSKGISISHGQALSVGIICETYISQKKFNFKNSIMHNIAQTVLRTFSPIVLTNSCNDLILDSIKYDKKSELNSYNFTLLKNIGQSVVNCSVDDSEILRSLDFYKKLCQL